MNCVRFSRRALLGTGGLGLVACCVAGSHPSPSTSAVASPPGAGPSNPFDALYESSFRLTPLSDDPINTIARPERSTGLSDALIDPAYGPRLYRATAVADGEGDRMRHEYSRRQAFNADNTRYLVQDGKGFWHLYDATTFGYLRKLPDLAGDCEPLWHPGEPNRLYFTERNGGMVWWLLDVETGTKEQAFDFTGRTPWPGATSFWTKGEGTFSADGKVLGLMATSYDAAARGNICHGLLALDLENKTVIGTLDASAFPVPGAFPDHISTAPSGTYVVPSWLAGEGGTVAYSTDFTQSRQLLDRSEHSDLALGPNHEDFLVVADYGRGQIASIDVATGERNDLRTLYPAQGEEYTVHISGQAFGVPGWAVISTYDDAAGYRTQVPAPTLRAEYRKVWLLELTPGGRALNVAHIRADWNHVDGDPYFLEPQASASRDLSRIIFATNLGGGEINSYVIGLPSVFA